ncbi:MAG: DUF2878 domain-containing protein [Candidatus Polarisedimenticolia bacterium]|nr:DUF2878 domain-containing protein [bacterium]
MERISGSAAASRWRASVLGRVFDRAARGGEPAPRWRGRLLNGALYQVGWTACVVGVAHGRPWSGAAVALALVAAHVALARRPRLELELVLCAGAIGVVVESVQTNLGMIAFRSGSVVPWLCPPWMVVLWMQFATLLRFGLSWAAGRYGAAALLGLFGGPASFAAGVRLGAADLHPHAALSVLSFAVVWSAAFPLLMWLAARRGPARGSYRVVDPPEPAAATNSSSPTTLA